MTSLSADAAAWVAGLGAWAFVVAPLVMTAVALLPVPAEAPAMMNGLLFGVWLGSLVSWSGAMAGAWISFEVSRRYGRAFVTRWVGDATLGRVDALSEGVGWWGLLLLRLTPVVAFTALNYGLGLTGVSRRRFLWTTAVGIAPGAVVFTSSGAGLGYVWGHSALAGWVAILVLGAVGVILYYRRHG